MGLLQDAIKKRNALLADTSLIGKKKKVKKKVTKKKVVKKR